MSTFTTIPDSSLAQDKPFTQSVSRALRDNPVAICEGDGTAPTFRNAAGAKAWLNFNGTGTVAIRGSFNIANIVDNGTGNYTVNLVAAMADANYVVVPMAANSNATPTGDGGGVSISDQTTTSFRVNTFNTSTTGRVDSQFIHLVVFGNLA